MHPRERRESGQTDLFRARLDQIVDMNHALARLGRMIDWRFVEARCGSVYTDAPGHPPLPTRLMAGLAILKSMHDLSDEALCDRWVENPYYQLFCGEEFFRHDLPFDRSSMTRWRQRMGEERLNALLEESLASAIRTDAAKPADDSVVARRFPGLVEQRVGTRIFGASGVEIGSLVERACHREVQARRDARRPGKTLVDLLARALYRVDHRLVGA